MKKSSLPLAALLLTGLLGNAEAQVSRVFVSVTGNDANTCSDVSTPCGTQGGGIAQVDAEGEVIVTTSGSSMREARSRRR